MPKPPPPAMGLTLQYLRSAHGWSPQELAAALGQDKGLIRKYEKGDKTLTRETLEASVA